MELFLIGALIFGGCALVSFAVTLSSAIRTAPYVATPLSTVSRALDLAELAPGELLVDLGAGDGRIVIAAARRGARAVGYEQSPHRALIAALKLRLAGVWGRARIIYGDFFRADLTGVDVIYVWLTPKAVSLGEKLRRELKPGARVVVHSTPLFPGWEPERIVKETGGGLLTLYRVR